tara:strand:+ start:1172 stop:1873 length:702 start_codon:yes stop_codon:yes gene_type:complete
MNTNMFGKLEKSELEAIADSIKNKIVAYVKDGKKVFSTSSFQSQSLPLLHIISETGLDIPIYYTNTGFLYPETIKFAEQIAKKLKLRVISLKPEIPKINQLDSAGRFFYTSDPDYCCYINKVKLLEPITLENDIWINGIRADQSSIRANMSEEQDAQNSCMRYHPMLQWNSKMIYYYRKFYSLPDHPLEAKGYQSIGCEPCTSKSMPGGNERNSRWFGMNKTECGLNTIIYKG